MINIKIAAKKMDELIDSTDLSVLNASYGKTHLHDMTSKIINGEIVGNKAHRWLGYMQGLIVIGGGATLEELKKINKGG